MSFCVYFMRKCLTKKIAIVGIGTEIFYSKKYYYKLTSVHDSQDIMCRFSKRVSLSLSQK